MMRMHFVLLSVIIVSGLAAAGAWGQATGEVTGFEPVTYYYGWQGLPQSLWLSTEQIGVAFSEYANLTDLRSVVAAFPDLELPQNVAVPRGGGRFRAAVVRLRQGTARERVEDLVRALQGRGGIHSALPVYYSARGKASLLTDCLSVVMSSAVSDEAARTLFEGERLEVLGVERYPTIGKVSYRLRLTPAARARLGRDTLTTIAMAHRLLGHPEVLEAAPMFTPLYRVQTTVPNPYPGLNAPPSEFASVNHWNLQLSKVDEAWEAIKLHAGPLHEVIVAVLDNGVWCNYSERSVTIDGRTADLPDPLTSNYIMGSNSPPGLGGHQDLNPNQWINKAEALGVGGVDDDLVPDRHAYDDDYYGWDFVGTNPYVATPLEGDNIPFPDDTNPPGIEPSDLIGHGTMASGVACALGNNGVAIAGMTWTAKVMPVRYHLQTYDSQSTSTYQACTDVYYCWRAERAIRYAADKGAQVIALMMAVETYDPGLRTAIEYAWAKGCFIAASAGNDNKSLDAAPLFPHVFPEVTTVGSSRCDITGATVFEERDDDPASGSNFGWTVEVVAPVRGTHNGQPIQTPALGIASDQDWFSTYGTSAAMPQVAGLAALLLSVKPTLSPLELRHIICSTADDIGPAGRDVYTGFGRINAAAAVYAALEPRFSVMAEVEDTTIPRQLSVFSIDSAGDVFFGGDILPNASQTDLTTKEPQTGEFFVDQWDNGTKSGLLRLKPGGILQGTPSYPYPAALYLKGGLQQVASIVPTSYRELLFKDSAGTYVARLDRDGWLQYRGVLHTKDELEPPYYTLTATPNALNDFVARVQSEVLTDAVAVVPAGTYNAVDFAGQNIVFRSVNPFDRATVDATVITGNGTQSAVHFNGTESDRAGLLGFTLTGGNATYGGGIQGNGTHAHILYNVIRGNTATSGGGGLHGCHGLIEYNVIGESGAGNGNYVTAGSGGGLHSCYGPSSGWGEGGYIRKNRICYNAATAGGGGLWNCDRAYIAQNYIANNNGDSDGAGSGYGGGLAGCDYASIRENIVYANSGTYGGGMSTCLNSTIEHNTVYGNTATVANGGGGVYNCGPTVHACILYANTPNPFGSANLTTCYIQGYSPVPDANGNRGGTGANPMGFLNYTDPTALGQFLHLASDSTCVDQVKYLHPLPARFIKRDFDDQVGPYDTANNPLEIWADIGAEEYPTPPSGSFVYWWEILR